MPKFAFKPYSRSGKPDRDDDVLLSRGHAERLRRHAKGAGYDASVERSGDEHRVVLKHPTQDLATYATRGDAANIKDPRHEPYWTFGKKEKW